MNIQTEKTEEREQKKAGKARVKVAIRVRPMISKEIASNESSCVEFKSNNQIILAKERNYKFDQVFKDDSPQNAIYDECIRELVLSCFEGYNSAVLAYGQTGSGKTFTMGTAANTLLSHSEQGIIPRVIHEIFEQVKVREQKAEFIIKVSFLEIYNEQIMDLLSESNAKGQKREQNITIREEKDGSVSLVNVTEQEVTNHEQMMELLERGGYHRTTASTLMNDASSRSHAIFTIFIEQHRIEDLYKNQDQEGGSVKNRLQDKGKQIDDGFMTAKFFFVDLAGSERAKKTGATGATLKQGININLGLLELGNVISALSIIDKKQDQFITYRNSKLTRILQECLGGNSNTYMIACISPAQSNFEESLNTLKYASKAMNIKNKPIKNVDPHTAQVTQLKQKIYELETENRKLKSMLNEKGIKVEEVHQSPDLMFEEVKKLKKMYLAMQNKYQEALNELKEEKKGRNSIEISHYDTKRERDIALLKLEELKEAHPNIFDSLQVHEQIDHGKNKLGVLNELSEKIEGLETELKDKNRLNSELEKEFESLQEVAKRDQKLLFNKNTHIYTLKKQNQKLKKSIAALKQEIKGQNTVTDQTISDHQDNEQSLQSEDDTFYEHEQLPEQLHQDEQVYNTIRNQTEQELKSMDRQINEKERYLQSMAENQIKLEYQLISEMKEEYHNKISILEKQKAQLTKQKQETIVSNEKNKLVNRIDNLQSQLKEYRKKSKQQINLEKLTSNQGAKLKELANEIKKFKMQKVELSKKMKEDKDTFQKFKGKKVKEIMMAKKDGLKKDNQIRKLKLDNNRKAQIFKKKQEELTRAKRINQTLKNIVKPSNRKNVNSELLACNRVDKSHPSPKDQLIPQRAMQETVHICIRKILAEIDQERVLAKYETRMKQLNHQLQQLLAEDSNYRIRFQRIQIKQNNQIQLNEQQEIQKQQLSLNLNDMKQRLANTEQSLRFCEDKYGSLVIANRDYYFDLDSQILYRKEYQISDNLKTLIKVLFLVLKSTLLDNYSLYEIKENLQLDISNFKKTIIEQKDKIMLMNSEFQHTLEKFREEMLLRSYAVNMEEESLPNSTNYKRMEEREKKNYEKKIVDLTKTNRQISHEVELWKRKCSVVQEKYQNIRSLLSKDKNIGLGKSRQEDALSDRKKLNQSKMMDEINDMTNQLEKMDFKKRNSNEQVIEKKQSIQEDQGFEYRVNQWENLGKIDAHGSAVLSIAAHANMLISTSTKSLKIWDLETSKIISDLSGPHLTGLVKYVIVDPERSIMLTACEKNVTIWDLITLNVECTLKGHKDEVRAMHISNDILFTGGKGSANSGGLLAWDLRHLDPNKPRDEKQRNQDIFTFASRNNILYYGTRNHHVRRLDMASHEVLSPFEPPHMDTVTGMAVVGDRVVSGSKDKNIRLWSLDHSIGNLKNTTHAFNDHVTAVRSDLKWEIFYAGSKDGQIKVGNIKNDRINFHGGILSHNQSINAIIPLEDTNMIATASSDKTIKLWKPTPQTAEKMQKQFA